MWVGVGQNTVLRLVHNGDDVRFGKKWEFGNKVGQVLVVRIWMALMTLKKSFGYGQISQTCLGSNGTVRSTPGLRPERVLSPRVLVWCDWVPSLCTNCHRPSAEEDRDSDREVPLDTSVRGAQVLPTTGLSTHTALQPWSSCWRGDLFCFLCFYASSSFHFSFLTLIRFGTVRTDSYLLRDGNGNVVHRQSSLSEQILAHVGEGGGRIDRITSHAVSLQVRSGIATLKWEERGRGSVMCHWLRLFTLRCWNFVLLSIRSIRQRSVAYAVCIAVHSYGGRTSCTLSTLILDHCLRNYDKKNKLGFF